MAEARFNGNILSGPPGIDHFVHCELQESSVEPVGSTSLMR